MKTINNSILFLVAIGTTLGLNSDADADRYNTQVNYDLVIQHSHDLEDIAADLKDCFRSEFRQSRYYGKLISRSNRLKNRSHSLHKHGVSHGTCNWQNEIEQIDELVCNLGEFVDQAIYRTQTGCDPPICRNTMRTVRRLLGKAEYHTAGLKKSFYNVSVNRPRCGTPTYNAPILEQTAPSFTPGQGIGYGVYRNGSFNTRNDWTQNYRTTHERSLSNRLAQSYGQNYGSKKGFEVNVGGFKFYVNK